MSTLRLSTLIRTILRRLFREVKEEVKDNPDLILDVYEKLSKIIADEGKPPLPDAAEALSLPDEVVQLPPEVLERIIQSSRAPAGLCGVLEETIHATPTSEITPITTPPSESSPITTASESTQVIMPESMPVHSSYRIIRLAKEIVSDVKRRPYPYLIVGTICIAWYVYKKRSTAALNNGNPNGGDDSGGGGGGGGNNNGNPNGGDDSGGGGGGGGGRGGNSADDFQGNWLDGDLEIFQIGDDSNDKDSSDDDEAIHNVAITGCGFQFLFQVFDNGSIDDEGATRNVAIHGGGFKFLVQVAIPVAPAFRVFLALTKFEEFTAPPCSPNNSKNLPLTAVLLKFMDAVNQGSLQPSAVFLSPIYGFNRSRLLTTSSTSLHAVHGFNGSRLLILSA